MSSWTSWGRWGRYRGELLLLLLLLKITDVMDNRVVSRQSFLQIILVCSQGSLFLLSPLSGMSHYFQGAAAVLISDWPDGANTERRSEAELCCGDGRTVSLTALNDSSSLSVLTLSSLLHLFHFHPPLSIYLHLSLLFSKNRPVPLTLLPPSLLLSPVLSCYLSSSFILTQGEGGNKGPLMSSWRRYKVKVKLY